MLGHFIADSTIIVGHSLDSDLKVSYTGYMKMSVCDAAIVVVVVAAAAALAFSILIDPE